VNTNAKRRRYKHEEVDTDAETTAPDVRTSNFNRFHVMIYPTGKLDTLDGTLLHVNTAIRPIRNS
jgi:hypothetical protein